MLHVTNSAIENNLSSTITKVSVGSNTLEQNENIDNLKNEINTSNVDSSNDVAELSSGDEVSALFRSNLELPELKLAMYSDEKSFIEAELTGIRSIVEVGARIGNEGKVDTHINDSGMAVFETPDYIIETDVNKGGHSVYIKDKEGETLARIHGDPHVDLDNDGTDDFHFGDDSRLLLNDGTEVFLNTENLAGTEQAEGYDHDKVFFPTGIYVNNGKQTFMTGESYHQKGTVVEDIQEGSLPTQNGSTENGALTFALDDEANAYIKDDDSGKWHELEDESWDGYLADPTFDDQIGEETDFSIEGSEEYDSPLTADYRAREADLESELA